MWVFGYGSLMWDDWAKEFDGEKFENAVLADYSRAFNKKSVRNWGSRENPGPTLGLEKGEGSVCVGSAFKFPDDNEERVTAFLNEREGPSFNLTNVEIELPDGRTVTALTPINDPDRDTYIGDKEVAELVEMTRNAQGKKGKCIDYVDNIYEKLREMNINDRAVNELWENLSE